MDDQEIEALLALFAARDDGRTTCIVCEDPLKWFELNCIQSGAEQEYTRKEALAQHMLATFRLEG